MPDAPGEREMAGDEESLAVGDGDALARGLADASELALELVHCEAPALAVPCGDIDAGALPVSDIAAVPVTPEALAGALALREAPDVAVCAAGVEVTAVDGVDANEVACGDSEAASEADASCVVAAGVAEVVSDEETVSADGTSEKGGVMETSVDEEAAAEADPERVPAPGVYERVPVPAPDALELGQKEGEEGADCVVEGAVDADAAAVDAAEADVLGHPLSDTVALPDALGGRLALERIEAE